MLFETEETLPQALQAKQKNILKIKILIYIPWCVNCCCSHGSTFIANVDIACLFALGDKEDSSSSSNSYNLCMSSLSEEGTVAECKNAAYTIACVVCSSKSFLICLKRMFNINFWWQYCL